jgi:hypothetical protein
MGYLIKKNTACKNPRYPKLDAAGRVCSELSRGRERRLKRAEFTDQFTPSPIQSRKLSQLTTLNFLLLSERLSNNWTLYIVDVVDKLLVTGAVIQTSKLKVEAMQYFFTETSGRVECRVPNQGLQQLGSPA